MAHVVDAHVGRRIRQRRWMLGMTQQELAEKVDIKFQQIQKYETGANRVSASRLWLIAQALDVAVSFFFDGLEVPGEGQITDVNERIPADLLSDREAVDLLRHFYAMSESRRRRFLDLARALSEVE
ncbi:Helix-turn-helix [Rhodovulum sp. ES.010]|uniref:helix-turn-helix domain-containing protein n=1 Tax=Rhodovulum sp. ES.010 TaxID=1882821 RepID=UPI00092B3E7A|nr:helix-turn-helix transcriptional regulator [Rhodovulum sp. ES.010]SIO53709.1 Helix-turn-helix [Rhodovulum sp. ES.010]